MILVTGATGFLGSEVVRQLILKNRPVVALKRSTSTIPLILRDLEIIWRDADLLNYLELEEAFHDITQVYHCAARVSFDPSEKKELIRANREGTANVVNLCLERHIRLVHVSSVAAVGESKNGNAISENNAWVYTPNQTGYAISKYESEMEVWRAFAEGLEGVIVNPSIIIGKHVGAEGSGRLFETVKKGLRFYPSGGCGLVAVEDVAAAMIRLMDSDITGERFILNGENWTYRDLFSEIALNLKVAPPTIPAPQWLLKLAATFTSLISIGGNKRFGLTSETARNASRLPNYANDRIRQRLGFEFRPIKESIKEVCETIR